MLSLMILICVMILIILMLFSQAAGDQRGPCRRFLIYTFSFRKCQTN